MHPDGVLTRTRGLFGGQPGGAVRAALLEASSAVVKDHGIGELVTLVRTNQVLEVRLAGYISPEGAARNYGIQIMLAS